MSSSRDHTFRILLRPHIGRLGIGAAAALIEGAASLAEPWPLKIVLDSVLKSKSPHGWASDHIFAIAGTDRYAVLGVAAVSVLVIAVIGAVCEYIEKLHAADVGLAIMQELRRVVYSHIQRLSVAYHAGKQTGDLVGCLTSDIDAIQSFIASGATGAFVSAITLAGMALLMLWVNWRLTLVAFSLAPLLFAIVFRYTRRIRIASRAVRKKEGEILSLLQEVLSSTRIVKAFVQEDQEQQRLEKESLASAEIALQVRGLKVMLSPIVDVIVAAGTALVLLAGGRMALRGVISGGSLVLFIWYLGKMYKPMRDLSKLTDGYARAASGYERIKEVLAIDREVRDIPGARPVVALRGEIEFDRVRFGYEPASPVLKHINLHIQPGQAVALVGPTGSGKTTIVSLIARFYDPDEGAVKIDGTDIRLFQQKSLRRLVSFVLQETLLFRGPVWYNIAYGKPGASRADVVRAAELANAHEFIERMPQGYDTIIGERGDTLSGGQRQRIAIARAVICDAPILILDEAATGLDPSSERLVFEALGRLMQGKTSVVISHHLTTLHSLDMIFVLKSGEIVERGTHEELLRNGGLYNDMHGLQSSVAGKASISGMLDMHNRAGG